MPAENSMRNDQAPGASVSSSPRQRRKGVGTHSSTNQISTGEMCVLPFLADWRKTICPISLNTSRPCVLHIRTSLSGAHDFDMLPRHSHVSAVLLHRRRPKCNRAYVLSERGISTFDVAIPSCIRGHNRTLLHYANPTLNRVVTAEGPKSINGFGTSKGRAPMGTLLLLLR